MGWYMVTKTINGKQYRYRQRTYREGGNVRTQSHYLGSCSGGMCRWDEMSAAAREWKETAGPPHDPPISTTTRKTARAPVAPGRGKPSQSLHLRAKI